MTKKKFLMLLILFLILFIFFYPTKGSNTLGVPTGCFDRCIAGVETNNSCSYSSYGNYGKCKFTCFGYNYNNCNGPLGSFTKKFTSSFEKNSDN